MKKNKWKKSVPKETGYFWFWGYLFDSSAIKELAIIKVRKISNGYIYIYGSHGVNPKELTGVFLRIEEPKINARGGVE